MAEPALRLVTDARDLPEYAIPSDVRLDSHYFIPWNLKRWRKSVLRQLADPDVGWFAFNLFCEAHDETPLGTLPNDETLLARALGLGVDQWRKLCKREITPLHGWAPVRCDTGEVRLAHPVVTEVVQDALKSSLRARAQAEERRRAKRLKDLAEMIEKRIGAGQLLRMPGFLDRFNDWLEERHPEAQRREAFVRQALEEFQLGGRA
jgi:hypothetical protein